MNTDTPAYLTATVELHIGSFNFVRPSMGAGVHASWPGVSTPLIVWGGEFDRTTTGQNGAGRNRYGTTDAITGSAVSGKVHLNDLHATILNQLGLDHTKLTYRYGEREFRLTDMRGLVVKDTLA